MPKEQTIEDVLSIAFNDGDWAFLQSIVFSLRHSRVKAVLRCADVITSAEQPNRGALLGLEGTLLYGKSAKLPFGPKIGTFPDKAIRQSIEFTNNIPRLDAIMRQISFARSVRIALEAAQKSAALHAFAPVSYTHLTLPTKA